MLNTTNENMVNIDPKSAEAFKKEYQAICKKYGLRIIARRNWQTLGEGDQPVIQMLPPVTALERIPGWKDSPDEQEA